MKCDKAIYDEINKLHDDIKSMQDNGVLFDLEILHMPDELKQTLIENSDLIKKESK